MKQLDFKLKNDIKVHLMKNDNFKTDLIAIFILIPLNREDVTKNALIPAVLKRGCEKYKTQNDINKKLEEMYGAIFDCGLDKTGDNLIIKFYLESINDNFLPDENNNLNNSIDLLKEIVFNPVVDDNAFSKEYVETEKQNLQIIIESKKDDKDRYALDKCINSIYGNNGYGLSKLGYIEDFDNIDEKNLYSHYLQVINKSKIDIFISGNFDDEKVISKVKEIENIKGLTDRIEEFTVNDFRKEIKNKVEKINEVQEKMDVMQGKLVLGLEFRRL